MNRYLPALLATVFLLISSGPLHAQYDRGQSVYFDNRSAETLLVYRAPISARSQPVRRLAPGESWSTVTGRDQQWVVSTPVWYRLVGSIKLSDGGWNRRLVIRNSDVNAIGRQPVTTTFDNRSRIPVKVNIVVEGKELDWMWIGAQARASTQSFAGQDWVIRTQSNGRFLQRASTPRGNSTITIDGRGGGGGGGYGRPPAVGYPPVPIPQQPIERHKVRINIVNDSSQPIYIYKAKQGEWKYVKRLNPRQASRLEFEIGQHISIRHPWSGDEIEQFRAPTRDTTRRIGDGRPGGRPRPR